MLIVLETERLVLRQFTPADVDNLLALDSDPDVMRFIDDGKPPPREVIENERLPALLAEYERHPGFGGWAAIEKTTGKFVGWLSLRVLAEDPPGTVELGYRLRRAAWGRGYATEGSRALIRQALPSSVCGESAPARWRSTPVPGGSWRSLACCLSGRTT